MPTERVLLIAGIVICALVAIYALTVNGGFHFNTGKAPEQQFAVTPYTPPTHLVTTGTEISAHARPDEASPTLVLFGPDVQLNITGRVSRGLGNDWYAISWNNQTAFVRVSDTTAGEGTPPTMEARQRQQEVRKPEEEDDQAVLEDRMREEEAQQEQSGPFELAGVNWVRPPSQRDFQRFYPRRALYSGQDGRVVLDCVADGRGRLNCSVADEAPRGFGFGNAAISISRQTRIGPRTRDGRSVEGGHIRLPLVFHAE